MCFRIVHLTESGLINQWMVKYWPKVDKCDKDLQLIKAQALTLEDTQASFLLLGLGIILSTILLFVETVVHYFKHK